MATAEHIRVLVADDEETRQIERDPVRQALAVALVSFANQIGATVVAEGVETELELEALRAAGHPVRPGVPCWRTRAGAPRRGLRSTFGGVVPIGHQAGTATRLCVR